MPYGRWVLHLKLESKLSMITGSIVVIHVFSGSKTQ